MPTMYRHPFGTSVKAAPSAYEMSCPKVTHRLSKTISRPRYRAGAISPMYKGMIMAASPTPKPTTSRPTVIWASEYAAAWMMVPMKNRAQPTYTASLRPYLSEVNPARTAPMRAPPDVMAVTNSCSFELRGLPRSEPRLTKTAEMTPVS